MKLHIIFAFFILQWNGDAFTIPSTFAVKSDVKDASTLNQSDEPYEYSNDADCRNGNDVMQIHHRRSFLSKSILSVSTISATLLSTPQSSLADETEQPYQRIRPEQKFGYTLTLPETSSFKISNKPLQTHLDEVNFLHNSIKGYQFGVTVDPIRINTIQDFGTPSEVAAKIVMAELRRDGVLDVTLAKDASEDKSTGAYDVEYVSSGTRGVKHFVTRSIIVSGKLFVLTAQVKEADWKEAGSDGNGPSLENQVLECVKSFRVLKQDEWSS